MKRLLFAFAMCFCVLLPMRAQIIKLKCEQFAYKTYNAAYGYWTDWTDWEDRRDLIVIDLNAERIGIYGSTVQEYDIYDTEETTIDKEGYTIMALPCLDADLQRCVLRVRMKSPQDSQLYVEYPDKISVYQMHTKQAIP